MVAFGVVENITIYDFKRINGTIYGVFQLADLLAGTSWTLKSTFTKFLIFNQQFKHGIYQLDRHVRRNFFWEGGETFKTADIM